MPAITFEKRNLLRWCVWFFLGHVLLFWLIGLVYLPAIPHFEIDYGINFFVLLSYLAHLAMLAISPCLILVPLALLIPWRNSILILAILIATINSSLLFIDTIVYNMYQFHVNGAVLTLAFHGITKGVMGLSFFEKIMPLVIIGVFLIAEWLYGRWLWRRLAHPSFLKGWFKWIAGSLALAVCIATWVIISCVNHDAVRVLIEKTRFLPLYVEVLGAIIPKKEENFALLRIDEKNPLQWITAKKQLVYPKYPLQFALSSPPMNLLFIILDTWRFDMLNDEVTPNLKQFARKSWFFANHFSGGNSTLPGIFSLFYGLPATYITAMETQHRGPVLFDTLSQQGYQLGIFSSAPLYTPPLDKSVFQSIKNLQVEKQPAETVFERDKLVTDQFDRFVTHRNAAQPFFSFLFFDAAHSYCGSDDVPGPFQPTAERCNRFTFNKKRDLELYLNRYKNALFSIDQQIKEVINILETNRLLENTVVLIVGDHGEEFDDSGRGYYGHASNFTRYQVQTPLIVYWPNTAPRVLSHQTSHFDVVPTLMTQLLGCQNQMSDYSVGINLLDKERRPYFVISSYVNFGVIEPEKITTIYSAGNYHIEKLDGVPLPDAGINLMVMRQVFNELQQYYQTVG